MAGCCSVLPGLIRVPSSCSLARIEAADVPTLRRRQMSLKVIAEATTPNSPDAIRHDNDLLAISD